MQKIINFKKDLEVIKTNFGNYSSHEIILLHKTKFPFKTKCCLLSILEIDKSITHSVNCLNLSNDDAKLKIILNFKKNCLEIYMEYVNKIH